MSLKNFHTIFIIASLILSAMFAGWGVTRFQATADNAYVGYSTLAVSGAIFLSIYLTGLRRKWMGKL